jgi:hypothetical protein
MSFPPRFFRNFMTYLNLCITIFLYIGFRILQILLCFEVF